MALRKNVCGWTCMTNLPLWSLICNASSYINIAVKHALTYKRHWIVTPQLFPISLSADTGTLPILLTFVHQKNGWEHPELLLADLDNVHNKFMQPVVCVAYLSEMSERQHGVVGISTPLIVPRLILPSSAMPAISKFHSRAFNLPSFFSCMVNNY